MEKDIKMSKSTLTRIFTVFGIMFCTSAAYALLGDPGAYLAAGLFLLALGHKLSN